MFLAEVIGTVVTPEQIQDLEGRSLLMLRPLTPKGDKTKTTRVGIDRVGAGVGDRVLVIDEGNSGRAVLGLPQGAVKTIIIGFVDSIELAGETIFDHRS